ncbi:MAG: hypothetical protein AAF602_21480 [Myxococcota bacterium]
MQSATRTLAAIAVLIGGGTACQTTPRLPGRDVDVTAQGRLEQVNPSDIAVVPVLVGTPGIAPPLDLLRRSAMKGLVRRRYSPLSPEIVDERMMPLEPAIEASAGAATGVPVAASFTPGDLGEDAVLEVTVVRWDDRSWEVRRSIGVGVSARMIDPRDPLGPELWAASIDRTFRLSPDGPVPRPQEALREACDDVFTELFARLPARDTSIQAELPAEAPAEPDL